MRIRTAIAVAALLPASLAFAVPASEDETCRTAESRTVAVDNGDGTTSDVPVEYCEAQLYAQCDAALDPAGKVVDPNASIKMTDAAPTVSFTETGGCGTVDEPVFSAAGTGGSPYQFAASGFADAGSVDALTFELHFLGPNLGYAGEPIYIDLEAEVNSVSLFGTKSSPDATGQNPTLSPAATRIEVVPVVSDSMASVKAEFTVTGLDALFDAVAPGTEKFHQVSFSFGVPHTGECATLPTNDTPRCAPSGFTGWVMGATEVPSGVTFNPAEPAAVTIPAVVPDADA